MTTITTPTQTQIARSQSRFSTAFIAFMAILRRDIVVTGREFIAFLLVVFLILGIRTFNRRVVN